jgi:hypothetical protein
MPAYAMQKEWGKHAYHDWCTRLCKSSGSAIFIIILLGTLTSQRQCLSPAKAFLQPGKVHEKFLAACTLLWMRRAPCVANSRPHTLQAYRSAPGGPTMTASTAEPAAAAPSPAAAAAAAPFFFFPPLAAPAAPDPNPAAADPGGVSAFTSAAIDAAMLAAKDLMSCPAPAAVAELPAARAALPLVLVLTAGASGGKQLQDLTHAAGRRTVLRAFLGKCSGRKTSVPGGMLSTVPSVAAAAATAAAAPASAEGLAAAAAACCCCCEFFCFFLGGCCVAAAWSSEAEDPSRDSGPLGLPCGCAPPAPSLTSAAAAAGLRGLDCAKPWKFAKPARPVAGASAGGVSAQHSTAQHSKANSEQIFWRLCYSP